MKAQHFCCMLKRKLCSGAWFPKQQTYSLAFTYFFKIWPILADFFCLIKDLFNKIKLDLSDDSFPTRTNRLEAVENMKKVLEIHNYVVSEYQPEKGEQ